MADALRGRGRYVLYAAVLTALLLLLGLTAWRGQVTGAYLTDEGDWQDLAGTYRIGVIDYEVTINDQTLIKTLSGEETGDIDRAMVAPLLGGVRIFDPTLTGSDAAALRTKEFNEGATLARVRVTNNSENMITVSAVFTLSGQSAGAHIRVLPLPADLDEQTARSLNYRQYVLDTLGYKEDPANTADAAGETAALAALDELYFGTAGESPAGYYKGADPEMAFDLGILPGAGTGAATSRDIFFLLWSEYGDGAYNSEETGAAARWAQLKATFTVGQLD